MNLFCDKSITKFGHSVDCLRDDVGKTDSWRRA